MSVPIAGPSITRLEVDYVTDAVANAWYEDRNRYHDRFETAFASHVRRRFAMALPSCTSALHLALASLGIGPGDEVVVPDITWIATAAPISYLGATPVFADVDRRDWCLSADTLEAVVTDRTKAAIVVDLYGNIPDMDALAATADRHGIALVEDAAQAVGATYRGRPAGSFGMAAAFSFHATKTLTTGEGGMLVTDDPVLYERCDFLRDHARLRGERQFWNAEVAYKYRMSTMQAALGLAQLERLDELIAQKRRNFAWYQDHLASVDGLELNHEAADVLNAYWMTTVRLDPGYGLTKEYVIDELARRGIACRPVFYPLSSLPAYAGHPQAALAQARNHVAYEVSPTAFNLPSPASLTRDQADYVCGELLALLKGRQGPGA